MSLFSSRRTPQSTAPSPTDGSNARLTLPPAARSTVVILAALFVVGAVATVAYGCWLGGGRCIELLLWALGLFTCGGLAGFLFGVPQTLRAGMGASGTPAPSSEASPGTAANPTPPTVRRDDPPLNDALTQISDWLTKIIVGLGLVNLHEVPQRITELAHAMTDSAAVTNRGSGSISLNALPHLSATAEWMPSGYSFAIAMIVFFPLIGMMLMYTVMRLHLQSAFRSGDLDALSLQQAREQGVREGIIKAVDIDKDYRQNTKTAQAATTTPPLPDDGPPPSDSVRQQLSDFSNKYQGVSDPSKDARIARKTALMHSMYTLAAESKVPKRWLVDQDGDAYLYALATDFLVHPLPDSAAMLLNAALRASYKHTKYRIVEAIQRLHDANALTAEQRSQAVAILKSYQVDADEQLLDLVRVVLAKLVPTSSRP